MKTIVITGSTRGIGYGLAQVFLARGQAVVVSGRSPASVDQAAAALQARQAAAQVLGRPCEVSDLAQVEALFAAAKQRYRAWSSTGSPRPRRPGASPAPASTNAIYSTTERERHAVSDIRLTEQQMAHFETFGYLGFPGLLADRAERIIQEFETLWARHGGGHAGKPHDGKARSAMVQFLDQSEYLSTLLDDPRIHGLAASLLGDDFNYMGSDGNFYAGDTRWHSDGYGGRGGPRHIKIAFYLDPLTRDTGALRVIPGSHRLGEPYADQLEREIRKSDTLWGVPGSQVPAQALETQAGDVLVFNHDLKHSAWGGSQRRRMFTMNLCQRYPEDKLDNLREYIGHGSRFWIERAYDDTIVRTASPARMAHLEQVMANDGHLAELSRQRRLADPEPARG